MTRSPAKLKKTRSPPAIGTSRSYSASDEKNRVLYFLGVRPREGSRTRTSSTSIGFNFDGKGLTLPHARGTPIMTWSSSASGKYFTDSYSKPDVPPVAVVRDDSGKLHREPGEGRTFRSCSPTGWKTGRSRSRSRPRDGQTDLYGPTVQARRNLDPNKKYPIVNHIYPPARKTGKRRQAANFLAGARRLPGHWPNSVSSWWRSTGWAPHGDRRSSTKPTTATWAINTLPDQVTGMKQLAQRYSWDRYRTAPGHLRATPAADTRQGRRHVSAIPNFFKVGILRSRANHDNSRVRRRLGREVGRVC